MIRPRPTVYHNAVRADEQFIHTPQREKRPLAWCSICGCRLSDYRPANENRCAPCITRHTATIPVDELHPRTYAEGYTMNDCPSCGGRKDRKAKQCHQCRHREETR